MAQLLGILIRLPKSREIKELQQVEMSPESGIIGDKRSRPGKRQVTLMSNDAWQRVCDDLQLQLPWTTRRANLIVDELPLVNSTGQLIKLGNAILEITGETDPCKLMEEAYPGLMEALKPEWRGGVTCRVLEGGTLQVGMKVKLEPT